MIIINALNKMIVTNIEKPIVVHSEKGRYFEMNNRRSFGLSVCISGQITYTMNGKTYVSNRNNAILLPQGGSYSLYGDKEGLFPVVNFKCENYNSNEIVILPLKNPKSCLNDFETLKDLFLHSENHLKIYSTFYELLNKITCENSDSYNPLRSVIQYIEENHSDTELSNTKLAQKMGISEVYLRKLFITHQNCTPKQYILNLRILKAKQMLTETSHSVTHISEECGFSSLYYFCRAFKEKTTMTPTEYANLNKIYEI